MMGLDKVAVSLQGEQAPSLARASPALLFPEIL